MLAMVMLVMVMLMMVEKLVIVVVAHIRESSSPTPQFSPADSPILPDLWNMTVPLLFF